MLGVPAKASRFLERQVDIVAEGSASKDLEVFFNTLPERVVLIRSVGMLAEGGAMV